MTESWVVQERKPTQDLQSDSDKKGSEVVGKARSWSQGGGKCKLPCRTSVPERHDRGRLSHVVEMGDGNLKNLDCGQRGDGYSQ